MSHHFVVTGGHHNSALVVAQALGRKGHKVSWFGHRYASLGDQEDSAEYIEVKTAKIQFYNLPAGKFSPSLNPVAWVKIPLGILAALHLLRRLRATAVISFGGYLGFACGLAALILHLPLYLHEQTVTAGKSNRLLAPFARRVFLTWESSLPRFARSHNLVVGLPLRPSFLHPSQLRYFTNSLPTLLVMGGKQGSHRLNSVIFANLEKILAGYNLIHQTGTSTATGDYLRSKALHDTLPPELAKRYLSFGYIGEQEVGSLLNSVSAYCGRSGAHITYELGLLGTPAVLVPFPHTHLGEQTLNAKLLEGYGQATIIPDSQLSYRKLAPALHHAVTKTSREPQALPRTATTHIVNTVLSTL